MRTLIFLVFMLAAITAQASKDKGMYIGGSFSLIDVGAKGPFANDVTFKAGEILIGYKYNQYLGLEIRGGRSLQGEVISVAGNTPGQEFSVEASIDRYISYYYRAELANDIAKVYILLGQTGIKTFLDFEDDGLSDVEGSESGLSYGIGFGLWLDERMNLNFEFKTLLDTDSDAFTSGSVSADFRF